MLQQLQNAHNKTAKNHRDKIRTLVSALFDESFDPMLEDIKSDLFGVEAGGRIVARDHPTLEALRALPPPTRNGMHPTTRRPLYLRARALHPAPVIPEDARALRYTCARAHHAAPIIPARARSTRRPFYLRAHCLSPPLPPLHYVCTEKIYRIAKKI